MSLFDMEIVRKYQCMNDNCSFESIVSQKISDDFLRICPLCDHDYVKMSVLKGVFDIQMEPNKPKTMGMIAQKNTETGNYNDKRRYEETGIRSGKKKQGLDG